MAIVPGFTAYNPYDLVHAVLAQPARALAWSVLFGLLTLALVGRKRAAQPLPSAPPCSAHWLLDVPMHTARHAAGGKHRRRSASASGTTATCRSRPSGRAVGRRARLRYGRPARSAAPRNGVRVSRRHHRRSAARPRSCRRRRAGRLRHLRAASPTLRSPVPRRAVDRRVCAAMARAICTAQANLNHARVVSSVPRRAQGAFVPVPPRRHGKRVRTQPSWEARPAGRDAVSGAAGAVSKRAAQSASTAGCRAGRRRGRSARAAASAATPRGAASRSATTRPRMTSPRNISTTKRSSA